MEDATHCDEECQEQGTLWKMPHTVMRTAINVILMFPKLTVLFTDRTVS